MKKELFILEVGVLLQPDNEEFDCYNITGFYENVYGFYDENVCVFLDYDKAKKYAGFYVKEGVDNTYAYIRNETYNLDEEDLKNIEDSLSYDIDYNFTEKDVIYFIRKENNNIIKEI